MNHPVHSKLKQKIEKKGVTWKLKTFREKLDYSQWEEAKQFCTNMIFFFSASINYLKTSSRSGSLLEAPVGFDRNEQGINAIIYASKNGIALQQPFTFSSHN